MARGVSVVDDLSGFCTSRAAGLSGNAIFLKRSLDLYEYERVGSNPLKLLATRRSAWPARHLHLDFSGLVDQKL